MTERYSTIVADPPWHYDSWPDSTTSIPGVAKGFRKADGKPRRKPLEYSTMTIAAIKALPVADLATKDAHLYLWTTNRYLRDAFGVVEAWGFKFGQVLTWCKTPKGVGPGGAFAQSTEFILFCRKGSPGQLRRLDSTWFNWPRSNTHSKKPEAFLDIVEQVSPGPYLELFARRNRLGWDTWGNESIEHIQVKA